MMKPSQRFLSFLRSGLRTNQVARASPRMVVARRMMSSHAGHNAGGDEKYWRIGAVLVFGPAFFYLLSPAARKTTHKHTVEHEQHTVGAAASHGEESPMTDDEGTAVSGEEVEESIEHALAQDSPNSAQEHEEEVAIASPPEPSSEPALALESKKDSASKKSNPGANAEATPAPGTEEPKTDAPTDTRAESEKPAAGEASAEGS
ncbi:hypothetical protein V8B97DRAFT_198835 [Scleroderma yunnanense]